MGCLGYFSGTVSTAVYTATPLPTLTMRPQMIQSFVGTRWRKIYEEAITREYRMLSFGDAMLLARRAD